MVCPVCKISTLIRERDGRVVRICRNPRCRNHNKVIKVIRTLPKDEPLRAPSVEGEEINTQE